MMMPRKIWKTLGIDQTTDRRAIRSAYAERLREIEVDSDPEAFGTLREAYEQALNQAEAHVYQSANDPEPGISEEADPVAMQSDEASGSDPVNPGVQAFHEVARILDQASRDGTIDAAESETLNKMTAILFDWLEQAPVDEAHQAEFGIAHILANGIPYSDPLLDAAATHFGWMETAGNWDKPSSVRAIVERIDTNRFYSELHDPGHPLHTAFLALHADRPQQFWQRPARKKVKELLSIGYGRYPGLISAFNPERVGEWERLTKLQLAVAGPANAGRKTWHYAVGVIVIMNALRLIGSALTSDHSVPNQLSHFEQPSTETESGPPSRPIYQDQAEDISDAIDPVFSGSLTARELRRTQPVIYQTAVEIWQSARDKQLPAYQMRSEIVLQLTKIFEEMVREADSAKLQRYWNIRQRMTARLPEMCDTYFAAGVHESFDPDLTWDYQALMRDVLLHSDHLPREPLNSRFSVPMQFVSEAEHLTPLDHAEFVGALKQGADPKRHCMAKSALVRVLTKDGNNASVNILRKL